MTVESNHAIALVLLRFLIGSKKNDEKSVCQSQTIKVLILA